MSTKGSLIPGSFCRWIGQELFDAPFMGLYHYAGRSESGQLAFIIATTSYEDEEDGWTYTQHMALALIGNQLGWAPHNWFEPLVKNSSQ